MRGSLFLNKTYSRSELKGLMEAILFVNGKSVLLSELCDIFEMSKNEIISLIDEINADYNDRKAGMNIISVAGGFQMVSNPHFKDEMEELFGRRNQNQLSRSALETLAIVAYKQPISKEDVDKIRGVSSTRSINMLLGYKLITISGSTDDVLKSPVYSTTKRFLELFRLENLDDLPSLETINLNEFSMDDEDEDNEIEDENGQNELELSLGGEE
jgi:segregation and condensation protein B